MKKGLTLIELMAVIIILAIISLIVFPIVMRGIEQSRERTRQESVKGYAEAVRMAVANYELLNGRPPRTNSQLNITTNNDNVVCNICISDTQGVVLSECTVGDHDETMYYFLRGTVYTTAPSLPNANDCEVYIAKPGGPNGPVISLDNSDANAPNLHANMIPVRWNATTNLWVKADPKNSIIEHQWYDYDAQMWANAVTVTEATRATYQADPLGTPINMDDILTMMVWIPRYEYRIQGTWGLGGVSAAQPGEIEVDFVIGRRTAATSGYIMHPAFTFGNDELDGFWVGKFTAGISPNVTSTQGVTTVATATLATPTENRLIIKPNVLSWRGISISNAFRVTQDLCVAGNRYGYHTVDDCRNTVDPHMLKNSQWGAIAYLSQSRYGKFGNPNFSGINNEVFINPSAGFITGRSGNVPSAASQVDNINAASANLWGYDGRHCNTKIGFVCTGSIHATNGIAASTTGNIYGVYDMSGGSWEYVMGNFNNAVGTSGFLATWFGANQKYFDSYTTANLSTMCSGVPCLGHALSEITLVTTTVGAGGWYSDSADPRFTAANSWLLRGGLSADGASAGVFNFVPFTGAVHNNVSFRLVHR